MDPGSIIGLVNSCFGIGLKIIELCSTWKNADREVTERVLIVESCWNVTRIQVSFVERITSIMDEEHCRVMDMLLKQLILTLSLAANNLEAVIKRSSAARSNAFRLSFRAKKTAWVLEKGALDGIISDLEKWQRRFDPSWYLLIKTSNPVLDRELASAKATEGGRHETATAGKTPLALAAGLRKVLSPTASRPNVFLSETQMEWKDIPFSDAKAGRRLTAGSTWYIVDTIELGRDTQMRALASNLNDVESDVHVLADKLSKADPLTFGLFNCRGVVRVKAPGDFHASPLQLGSRLTPPASLPARSSSPNHHNYSRFQIFFQIPRGMESLKSLRAMLLRPDEHMSLSWKMLMARELGKAVNYVHTFAFVHKNIRPESILCFEDPQGVNSHAFLVGFDAFRAADGGTMMEGDMIWARNVYRHPKRQGMDPSEKYTMQHDIYSLGVCLLEIGLWEPFVDYDDESRFNGAPQTKFGKFYHEFKDWSRRKGGSASSVNLAFQFKDYLVEQAQARLPPRMGDKYARTVVSCLTCLDEDNEDFGALGVESDEFIAAQFIERILQNLHDISL